MLMLMLMLSSYNSSLSSFLSCASVFSVLFLHLPQLKSNVEKVQSLQLTVINCQAVNNSFKRYNSKPRKERTNDMQVK